MTEILIRHLEKSYGERSLLHDVSLTIPSGSHIGIVGPNGAGKSTFLQMIAGNTEADKGQIRINTGATIALLPQEPKEPVAAGPLFFSYLRRLGGSYREDWEHLSGGERTKLALAALLAVEPALLLLDEPTNHLDYTGVESLITALQPFSGTLLMVSHDRYFLDRSADKILEIDNGTVTVYEGNYSDYRREKEKNYRESLVRYEEDRKQQKQIEAAIRQKKDWASKAHRDSTKPEKSGNKMGAKEYKRNKAKKLDNQTKSQIKKLEKAVEEGEQKPRQEKSVYFSLNGHSKDSRGLMEAKELKKSFDGRPLLLPSSFYLRKGEKAALFGANGCGKTTLFRMVLGQEELDGGDLWLSPAAQPFFLSQQEDGLPEQKTVEAYFKAKRGLLTGKERTDLHNFGLTTALLRQKIYSLSMGERIRLRMAEAVLDGRNLLFLDEPTNHLDLPAREQLEKTLAAYEGTLLIASHDIYFLSRICDKVLLFHDGQIQRLEDSFAEFWQKRIKTE